MEEKKSKITVCVVRDNKISFEKIETNLKALQSIVGGNIEVISGDGWVMIVDEDGKMKGKSLNYIACRLMERRIANDWIVGTAVLIGAGGEDFCSIPKDMMIRILNLDPL